MACFLTSRKKADCTGCEACVSACATRALRMVEDAEGFRYPEADEARCVRCGVCRRACPQANPPALHSGDRLVFGGYAKDEAVRDASTSGGAFSAIADVWCGDGDRCAVFGATAKGLDVAHAFVEDFREVRRFRKSKYLQSVVGDSYRQVRAFLREGRRVLFSGTPCQVAGLRAFLGREADDANLLTVEVVCEGVPTPLYVRKFCAWLGRRQDGEVTALDYRFKDGRRWDFQVMQASLQNPTRGTFKWKQDRWFNPFWSIWLQHLMSRPSCGECPFARPERGADVTLGDLWGVHLYCPDLYGRNGGSSLVVANTAKGRAALVAARAQLNGRELAFADALRYQGPMRRPAGADPRRAAFMADVASMPYEVLCRKWAKRPTLTLLFRKYVWGNRQKVWLHELLHHVRNVRPRAKRLRFVRFACAILV